VRHRLFGALLSALIAVGGCAPVTSRVSGPAPERAVLERVIKLLPCELTYPIVIIDPDGVPDSRAVQRLDAFTVREADGSMRPKIYLNREAFVVREAVKGTDFYVKVLAAIVVHEAAHLSGGSETDARRAESRFFADLIARGVVDGEKAERYLAILRERESAAHGGARDIR
jgi:hypothetical protein